MSKQSGGGWVNLFENKNMYDVKLSDIDNAKAQKPFNLDVKKHINDIASKYIITDETSDGAVMFLSLIHISEPTRRS